MHPYHPASIFCKAFKAINEGHIVPHLLGGQPTHRSSPEDWYPPPPGTLKLNIDGSFHPDTGVAGIGCILRTDEGILIEAFASATTAHSALEAELKALLRGLTLCQNHHLQDVIIEGD